MREQSVEVGVVRVKRREQRREDRHDQEREHDEEAHDRHRPAQQALPHQAQTTPARTDRSGGLDDYDGLPPVTLMRGLSSE